MSLVGVQRAAAITDLPIRYRYVLGESEESEPFVVHLDAPLTWDEAQHIASGDYGLLVGGFLTYRDVWGNDHNCPVAFSYNNALKRLDAQIRPEKKAKHSGLSRFLPSHWWPQRRSL